MSDAGGFHMKIKIQFYSGIFQYKVSVSMSDMISSTIVFYISLKMKELTIHNVNRDDLEQFIQLFALLMITAKSNQSISISTFS